MNLETFLLMRHEIVLAIIILVLLLADIFIKPDQKKSINYIAVGLFALHTLIGFIPLEAGSLFGGMFNTTPLVIGFKNILNVGVLIIMMISVSWVNKMMLPMGKVAEFYVLMISSLLGMFYMVSSGNFLMMYLSLELATLPVAALASYNMHSRKSSEAGIKLILSAAFSSGILLFGISMIYAASGSLYFTEIAGNVGISNMTIMGLIMIFAGFGFKISLVPFHFWTADVYEGAPTPVSNFLSTVSKGSAVFIFMIVLFITLRDLQEVWTYALYGIAILTMFVGNFFAIRQTNVQRMMAFSSVAQAGFFAMGMLAADSLSVAAVVYFIALYMFSNIAVFGVIQAVKVNSGRESIDEYNGLYRTNPYLSIVMMLGLFSLAGIPPIAGFFGKFFIYSIAASQGYYWLVFIAVANVTISLYYYLLIIRASWLRTSETTLPYFKSDILMRIGLVATVVILLGLGVYSPFYDYIYSFSSVLF